MTYGNIIIKKCPNCENLIQERIINSGNNIGATYWTDGKCEAPMLPDQPWFIICPHCKTGLWINELEKVAELEFLDELDQTTLNYITPDFDDCMRLLKTDINDTDKEYYLRIKTFWLGNDKRRTGDRKSPLSIQEISNLESFAKMLDTSNENDILMKAEIMRELGNFDEAQILLSSIDTPELSHAVKRISSLVEQGDYYVREIV